ncbi:MAG: hypothetical protein [Circular genetic element sp.]|nr:MAG: hypothetical protein [Circular genetic element sp.]
MASKMDWTFVEIKLGQDDKPALEEFLTEYDNDPLEILDDISELGYKVSISYVDDQSSYVVTVSGTKRSGLNNKQSVTSWSNNLAEACTMAGYKVLVIAKNKDWVEFETGNANWG